MKGDKIVKPNTDTYLVVMPHHPDPYGNIRLALKLWRKHCTFKYEFVVIGDYNKSLEKEFPWVHFIYCSRVKNVNNQYVAHLDLQNKYKIIESKYANKYKGFIRVADDCYAIKPFTATDILTVYYHQPSFSGEKDKPTNFWRHDVWKTRQLLDREKLPHINYTIHCAYYFEFAKIKELRDKYNLCENSYCLESLYFNYFTHETPVIDTMIRYSICEEVDRKPENLDAALKSKVKFMFSSNRGWHKSVGKWLTDLASK